MRVCAAGVGLGVGVGVVGVGVGRGGVGVGVDKGGVGEGDPAVGEAVAVAVGEGVVVGVEVGVGVAGGVGVGDPLAFTKIGLLVPVMEGLLVSVAVTVWFPGVPSITLKMPVPLVNVLSGGR